MQKNLLMDMRTGETGSLDWFFNRLTMRELGCNVVQATAKEVGARRKYLADLAEMKTKELKQKEDGKP